MVRLLLPARQSGRHMDFGDVLKNWEKIRAQEARAGRKTQGPGRKANAPAQDSPAVRGAKGAGSAGASGDKAEPDTGKYLERWLAIHGVPDKDSDPETDRGEDRAERIREAERVRRMKPQAVLDLHSRTAAEAEALLQRFLSDSARQGLEKVLIIHGKGIHSTSEHVMTEVVRRVLENNALAGNSGPADRDMGGRGATWVRIRTRDYFSR